LAHRLEEAWRWSLAFVLLSLAVGLLAGEPVVLSLALALLAMVLFACRADFPATAEHRLSRYPAWLLMLGVVTVVSSVWLLGRV
jgi:lysylphosphatidylglycerol synthetase-like protein (DUF2156 family)